MQSDSDDSSDYSNSDSELVTGKDHADLPPLHEAAAKNDVKQLTKLMSQDGIDVDLRDKSEKGKNRTALHIAAINNVGSSHFEVAEILLNNGADPNAKDAYKVGLTPLWYLIRNCDIKISNLFLKFKADFTFTSSLGSSLLTPATKNCKNLEVVKFLVEDIGLNVNHREEDGTTPLIIAASWNKNDSHYEVLEYLLKNGADVNARDNDGLTPLYCLVSRANWRVVDLFLNYKADVNAVTDIGLNILFGFNDEYSDVRVMQKLIDDYGLNVNHLNTVKETPLHFIADLMIKIGVTKCLLKNGADMNAPDQEGHTPFIAIVSCLGTFFGEERLLQNLDYFDFLIDQTDFKVAYNNKHIFSYHYNHPGSELIRKCILKHLAKLKFLSIPIHSLVLKSIENHIDYEDYFSKCTKELEAMNDKKPKNSWITYFNLLVDSRRKLKNYSGNKDLTEDCKNKDWLEMFPIYGASMKKNVEKGVRRRELFDRSSVLLSDCLPIFNSTHLIVKDILDCVLSKKDLSLFCKCRFLP